MQWGTVNLFLKGSCTDSLNTGPSRKKQFENQLKRYMKYSHSLILKCLAEMLRSARTFSEDRGTGTIFPLPLKLTSDDVLGTIFTPALLC